MLKNQFRKSVTLRSPVVGRITSTPRWLWYHNDGYLLMWMSPSIKAVAEVGGQLLAGVRCDHDGSGRWTCQPQAGTRGWHSCRQGVPLLRPLTDWAVRIVHTIRVPGSSSPTLVPLPHRANITTLSFRPLLMLTVHFWGNRTEHKINAYKANKKCCYYKKTHHEQDHSSVGRMSSPGLCRSERTGFEPITDH